MINFNSLFGESLDILEKHYQYLIAGEFQLDNLISFVNRTPPEGYEDYRCIDIIGKNLVWVNENFKKEQYKWYLWFESIFLVPPEMYAILLMKFGKNNE